MAGHRPADWHVLDLDRDPTPGDPDRVRTLAKTLHDFADDVSDALKVVKGMADDDATLRWAGKSAAVFKDEFSGVPKNFKKLKKSYELCGDALAAYWPKLERAQALADRALVKARAAQNDLSSAKSRLASADSWVTRAGKEADKYKDDPTGAKSDGDKPDEAKVRAATRDVAHAKSAHTKAQSDVTDAQDALSAAKKMAEDARRMREDAAGEAKRKIDEASDAGIQNWSWWQDVGDWFEDNWDTIVTVCKVVVAVVGIVAMIIGGPILGVIVLVAALVVLADTLYKYSKGQASLWDVGFAALDCIPGMKGLTTLGGLAKGMKVLGKGGLKGMALGLRELGPRVKGLGRDMKSLFTCGDPIDMATGQMVMSITDVALPGVLPLVVERSHRTGVLTGGWFGTSWTSTLDQRLLVDRDGIRLVVADGMVLHYAALEPDERMRPVFGPDWGLEWDGSPESDIVVTQPESGTALRFGRIQGACDGELPLVGIQDRNGNRVDVHYTADGAPSELVHHGGYRVDVRTEGDRVTGLALASAPGRPTLLTYEYDESGRLAGVVDSSTVAQCYSYDDQHRITGWRSRIGDWYRYAYDDSGRCVRTGGDDGVLAYTYTYDEDARRTIATDSLGHSVTYVFNADLLPVRETDPLGHDVTRRWDDLGRLQALTDPLGRTTRFTYDAQGNVTYVVRPDGGVVATESDEFGRANKVTQPDGSVWESQYDSNGNQVAITDPLGAVTRFTYDACGGLTSVTDALGRCQRNLINDAAGLVVGVDDGRGARETFTRDAYGRITELVSVLGSVTRVGWTAEGQIAWRQLPNGTEERWRYDAEGNPREYSSSNGRRTTYENTHFDLCTLREDEDGTLERFAYDSELRLRSVTNATGQQWSYSYDGVGRLVSETDFNGRSQSYRYDAAGRLVERVNGADEVTRFRHDLLGNVVAMESGDATTTYEYDLLGRIVAARNAHVRLGREYDAVGRLLAESWNGQEIRSTYDIAGRRIARKTPSGAVTQWAYEPDQRALVQQVGQQSVTYRYDIAGREVERVLGDAARLTQEWDAERLSTRQRVVTATGDVRQRAYRHRSDGALTSVTDSLLGERTFAFDRAGRITSARGGEGWDESYEYDILGNLTDFRTDAPVRDPEAGPGDRVYSGSLLRRAGRTHYRHDDQGRVVQRTTRLLSGGRHEWHYLWNAEDQLTGVLTPDGERWRYLYDPIGRRVAKQLLADSAESVTEQVDFFWDGDQLAEQTDGTVSVTWDWTDGPTPVGQRVRSSGPIGRDAPQAEIDEQFYAIVTDLLGTPTELVDTEGAVAWTRSSTLWGVPVEQNGDRRVDCPLRFPGQYYDAETGLHYNHHRYYEPGTARYLSPDPLGRTPAPNHHAYVKNPLQWKDPLGLKAPCLVDLYHGTLGQHADNILANGVDINASTRKMDFGRGGFYVTNNPQQALDWSKKMVKRHGGVPAVIHFKVPKAELDNLSSKIFDGPGDEVAEFIRHHRKGGAMHNFERVEGPMLYNLDPFLKKGAPPDLGGHQIALFGDRAADLFSNSIHRRVGPPTS
ncbi:DUF3990 domain-containing protein [Streptomyces griseoviridis]|uniref:DUF3990 domain-containing protein n=1 Tax=Streptomyces griseoviridis TaxID=45398 RepID=A0A3Q9KRK6_STRGD|nr:RHS repeat-associated core domain-containing protein [Streptomyces griseoviridis]AZS85723.1 DUF3990 domain-containing protein [Streptomyces griseoviridis]QCN87427.1 Rhs protein [Streptomyces griseoviridis]